MKLTVSHASLRTALASIATNLTRERKHTYPVILNVLLEAGDDGLRLTATDLDTWSSVLVPAQVEVPGATSVPLREFNKFIKGVKASQVELSLGYETLTVQGGAVKIQFGGITAADFPKFAGVTDDASWKTPAGRLTEIFKSVAFAVSKEETRPILNGVLLERSGANLTAVATNGHQLAELHTSIPVEVPGDAMIVLPKALSLVQKVFHAKDEVEVLREKNYLLLRTELAEIGTRLIEGPYPNYRQAIPTNNDKTLVADRNELLYAVRAVAGATSDECAVFSLGGPVLQISDFSRTVSSEVGVGFVGGPLEIVFKLGYVVELLKQFTCDEIKITFSGPERAALFTSHDDHYYQCVLMPFRLPEGWGVPTAASEAAA